MQAETAQMLHAVANQQRRLPHLPSLIALLCCHLFQCDFRRCTAVCGRRVEARVIRRARLHGLLHRVVDVEDHALRTVFAVRLLVFAFDNGEGLQNVFYIGAPNAVEVELGRVGLI